MRDYIRNEVNNSPTARNRYVIQFRIPRSASMRTAQYQGLLKHYKATAGGEPITLGWLYQNVMLPALAEFMRPYVQQANADRKGDAE
ncbi:MAG: hypothetical protein MJZ81_07450 [Bacteroidales bacterium]|nr:hypothetical protein [Bacteroidales bacterium]